MDLGILNTIIALVIVLLVLSLLVQAIQTLIKKLLKMKSRQIEGSLKDLYEQVVGANPEAAPPSSRLTAIWTTIKRILGMKINVPETAADIFKDKVLDQFKNIGRKTLFGNAVLDSLSKSRSLQSDGQARVGRFLP